MISFFDGMLLKNTFYVNLIPEVSCAYDDHDWFIQINILAFKNYVPGSKVSMLAVEPWILLFAIMYSANDI